MTGPVKVITSTADLAAAPGLGGIAKAVSAAITGGLAAGAAALTVAAVDGAITGAEWVVIGGAVVSGFVAAGLAAYIPANQVRPVTVVDVDPPGEHAAPER